jgi:hypothetical protein
MAQDTHRSSARRAGVFIPSSRTDLRGVGRP